MCQRWNSKPRALSILEIAHRLEFPANADMVRAESIEFQPRSTSAHPGGEEAPQ